MPASKRAIERHPRRCLDCSAGSQRRCQPALPPADKRYLTDDLCGSHSRDLTLAPVANGHWPFRCIKRYTSYTRGVKEFQSYTAKQRYTALYSIQLYSAIHYTTSTSPLCFGHIFGRVSLSELYDDPATQNSRNDDKTRTKYKIHLSQKTNNNLAKLWKF